MVDYLSHISRTSLVNLNPTFEWWEGTVKVQVRAVGNRGLLRAKAYYLLLGSPAWLAFLLHCHSTEGAAIQQRSMTLASHIMS